MEREAYEERFEQKVYMIVSEVSLHHDKASYCATEEQKCTLALPASVILFPAHLVKEIKEDKEYRHPCASIPKLMLRQREV